MPPKETSQESGTNSQGEPEIPALRQHDVAPIQGGDIPRLRDRDIQVPPAEGSAPVPEQSAEPGAGRQRAQTASSGIVRALALVIGLSALGIAIWLGMPVLKQFWADRSETPSAASPGLSTSALPSAPGVYDEAKPGFREYHVWMTLHDAPDFSPHAGEVIAEIAKTAQAIPGMQILVRIPRQYELSAAKTPADTFRCDEPNYSVWQRAVRELTDSLAKKGATIGQIHSPRFEPCSQNIPATTSDSDTRLYRIVIRLESPALP